MQIFVMYTVYLFLYLKIGLWYVSFICMTLIIEAAFCEKSIALQYDVLYSCKAKSDKSLVYFKRCGMELASVKT